jgi:hemolysin activation/secretion protein
MKKINFLIFIGLFSTNSYGADAESIQRIQQNQLQDSLREQELEQATKPPSSAKITLPTPSAPKPSASQACLDIAEIKYEGNSVISNRTLKKITQAYTHKCLSISQINTLLKDITNVYMDAGYVTSRAFMVMPQTELKQKILQIKIVEGKLAEIKNISAAQKFTAFPGLEGEVLNLRDIEQGLEQINRLASNAAQMDIKAAAENYYSDIIIKNTPNGTNQVSLFGDNAGSKNTGEWRVGTKYIKDNLLGLNDQINLSLTHAPSESYEERTSNAITLGTSIPLGYWTFANNFSWSNYRTSFELPISQNLYYTYGDTINNGFSVDRILSRGQKYKLSATAGITYQDTENYTQVLDLKLKTEASSRTLSVANFDLPLTLYYGGVIYLKPSYVVGTKLFGALDDAQSSYTQKAQYEAYKFYGYWLAPLPFGKFNMSVDSQYSEDELYSSEAFYVGGLSSVRGFKEEGVQGDSGLVLRHDLSFDFSKMLGSSSAWAKLFTPGIFFDYGQTHKNSDNSNAYLAGAGAKLDINYGAFEASLTYAKILQKPESISENHAWYFYSGLNFKF